MNNNDLQWSALNTNMARVLLKRRLMHFCILLTLVFIVLTIYLSTTGANSDGPTSFHESLEFDMPCRYSKVEPGDIRVMSFNLWYSGGKVAEGLNKIAKHINLLNPDFVCLQEVTNIDKLDEIVTAVGSKWKAVGIAAQYTDSAVLTRHPIIENETFSADTFAGTPILVNGKLIRAVGGHLAWKSFGPYAGQNKKVTKLSQFLGGEDEVSSFSNRVENVKNLLDNKRFQRWIYESDKVPLFICGDFNTPTHLDWVESTKDTHGGWVYEWPATKLLQDSTGLADAYRVKYPDPKKNPGYTWSTVQKFEWDWNNTIPEPQDRIDFIYFKKELFDVKHAFTYCGNTTLQPIPNEYKNDYPSDHYAVVGDFNYKKT